MTLYPRTSSIRAAFCVLGLALACALPTAAQSAPRTLSGSITDTHHEPLRGAIVELQNPADNSVVTFITQANGQYTFKRLNGDADYSVWVLWHGHKSKIRSISKFDSHLSKVINFTVRPY